MYRKLALLAGVLCLAAIGLVVPARADIVVPGADGSDGAFNPTDPNTVVDLSLAPTGEWNGTNQSPGYGVYDPNQWAVVFRYTSVNIASGKTVTFINHPARAPVVWLVSGSVTINGTVSLNGQNGLPPDMGGSQSEPGPGGFRGGRGEFTIGPKSSGGFGPGGSRITGSGCNIGAAGASYGTGGAAGTSGSLPVPPTYGLPWLLPLIGGSGGGGLDDTTCPTTRGGAGAGAGALLAAAAQTITLGGVVRTNGGNYIIPSGASGGSGGAIRLVADTIQGSGSVYALGGSGYTGSAGKGRIRLEANNINMSGTTDPNASIDTTPFSEPALWPDANAPTVRVISIGGVQVPADPRASFTYPLQDVSLADYAPQTAVIEARHVPLSWTVAVRVIPKSGPDSRVFATYVSGDETLSTWHADLTFPNGFSAVQVRASQTPPPSE